MDEPPQRRPSISQLSKTPSWVMLGFIIGALVVWPLSRREPPPAPRPIVVAPSEPRPAQPSQPPVLTVIEAVFGEWSEYAVWDGDLTQVALWNAATADFSDLYEVRRAAGVFYFRTIPRLTNRILRHGKLPPPECPLRFTETEEQYREWRENGRFERPPELVRPSIPARAPVAPPAVEVRPVAPLVPAPGEGGAEK